MTAPDEIADLPYADLLHPHSGPLAVEGDYDTVHFDRLAFEDDDRAEGARFLESAVTDCVFAGTHLRRARFNDLWISGTRLTGVSLAESDWLDSALVGCSLAGVEAFGSVLRRVTLRRCKLDSVNLRGAALHEVAFEDCVLRDVDFGEARLDGVTFPGSRPICAARSRSTSPTATTRCAARSSARPNWSIWPPHSPRPSASPSRTAERPKTPDGRCPSVTTHRHP